MNPVQKGAAYRIGFVGQYEERRTSLDGRPSDRLSRHANCREAPPARYLANRADASGVNARR